MTLHGQQRVGSFCSEVKRRISNRERKRNEGGQEDKNQLGGGSHLQSQYRGSSDRGNTVKLNERQSELHGEVLSLKKMKQKYF